MRAGLDYNNNDFIIDNGTTVRLRITKASGAVTSGALGAGVVHASAAGLLSRSAVDLATDIIGTLAVSNGGTGVASWTTGQLVYAINATAIGGLNDVATGNVLISGGVGVAPSYGKVGLTTHVSGQLPAANGGTGLSSLGTGIATWLGTPSSANLAAAVTDETGSGALVFANSPSINSPAVTGAPTFISDTYVAVQRLTGSPAGGGGMLAFRDQTAAVVMRCGISFLNNDWFVDDGTTPRLTVSRSTGVVTLANGLAGVTTNSNAAAGIVGEYISSSIASGSAVSLTTGVSANVTSISLTAGDWEVYGQGFRRPAGGAAVCRALTAGISHEFDNTLPTAPGAGAIALISGVTTSVVASSCLLELQNFSQWHDNCVSGCSERI